MSAAKRKPKAEIPKARMGRPPYQPNEHDRERVLNMVVVGIDQERIAAVLGIALMTLRKYFPAELERGLEEAHGKVVGNLLQLTKTHPVACIYYLNNRLPHLWKDQRHVRVDTPQTALDLTHLEPEQLALVRQALALMRPPKVINGTATEDTDE